MEIAGRVAVVTGAAGGIGAALSDALAHEGARVALGDLDAGRLQETVARLRDVHGDAVTGCAGDSSSEAGLRALLDHARETHGPIDILCANAGLATGSDLGEAADWERCLHVNVLGPALAARLMVPEWLERGEGCIVITASAAGMLMQLGDAPYTASKHAAVGLAEWLAATYADRGIQVHCLCPMGVQTALIEGLVDGGGQAAAVTRQLMASSEILEPPAVAASVIAAIQDGHYLVLPHPEVLGHVQGKARDPDRWVGAMARLRVRAEEEAVG